MSGQIEGEQYDLRAVTAGSAAGPVGVAHEQELVALAEAVVRGDEAGLGEARRAALAALGPEAFVAAAAVASNFERMVRIADGTGIPLDGMLDAISGSLREEIGIDAFASAANTPRASAPQRLFGRALAPLARFAMPWMARLSRRSAGR